MGGDQERSIFSKFALLLTISTLLIQVTVSLPFLSDVSIADQDTRSTANWTVMVYMAGDNNLRNAAIDDLNEMEVAGSSDEVNIIALLDGNVDGDTKLYYVRQDPNGYHSSIVSEELDAEWMQDELNMGDQKVLINFTN